jgi:hypothetical protein
VTLAQSVDQPEMPAEKISFVEKEEDPLWLRLGCADMQIRLGNYSRDHARLFNVRMGSSAARREGLSGIGKASVTYAAT